MVAIDDVSFRVYLWFERRGLSSPRTSALSACLSRDVSVDRQAGGHFSQGESLAIFVVPARGDWPKVARRRRGSPAPPEAVVLPAGNTLRTP